MEWNCFCNIFMYKNFNSRGCRGWCKIRTPHDLPPPPLSVSLSLSKMMCLATVWNKKEQYTSRCCCLRCTIGAAGRNTSLPWNVSSFNGFKHFQHFHFGPRQKPLCLGTPRDRQNNKYSILTEGNAAALKRYYLSSCRSLCKCGQNQKSILYFTWNS